MGREGRVSPGSLQPRFGPDPVWMPQAMMALWGDLADRDSRPRVDIHEEEE